MYFESRAFPGMAKDIYNAIMLFDYLVNHGKSESSAFIHFLCRKIWLKYLSRCLFIHSHPRIRNSDNYGLAGLTESACRDMFMIQVNKFRAQAEYASFEHRISCVHSEVHQ